MTFTVNTEELKDSIFLHKMVMEIKSDCWEVTPIKKTGLRYSFVAHKKDYTRELKQISLKQAKQIILDALDKCKP